MRAAILKSKQNIVIENIEKPVISSLDEVIVKIDYCGICGSDKSKYFHRKLDYPIIMGHEITGKVVEGCVSFLGQQVSIIPKIVCYKCNYCLQGKYNLCQNKFTIGSKNIGGFSEYIKVPTRNISFIKLKDIRLGVLIEPLANVFHICSFIKYPKNIQIGIVGLGNIGSLVKKVLNLYYNIDNIICIYKKTDIKQFSNICDCVIECSGKCSGLSSAINICKPEGYIIQASIIYSEELNNDLQYDKLNRKELTIKGSFDFNIQDWQNACNFIQQYSNKFIDLIGEEYELEDINKAFNIESSNKKIIIKI